MATTEPGHTPIGMAALAPRPCRDDAARLRPGSGTERSGGGSVGTVGASDLVIGSQAVRPGTRQAIRLPVTVGLNGAELALWVHAVHGARPGIVFFS